VLLVAEGWTPLAAAHVAGCSLRAVYGWLDTYLAEHELEHLVDSPRSGRPPVAPAITDARIKKEIARDPLALGYNALEWTAPLLATHLSALYDTQISADTLRRRMRRLGLRWKRPRHAFKTKDPNRAQKKAQSFEN
jgi:transposase